MHGGEIIGDRGKRGGCFCILQAGILINPICFTLKKACHALAAVMSSDLIAI